jgi:pimeloyl-ACP methyl ester carboxylesterase
MDLTAGEKNRVWATKDALSKITVPTLILHGEQDKLIPVAAAQKFAEAIPGAKLVTYPDAGHLPQEEVASESAGDLRAFLTGLNAPEETAAEPSEGH